MATVEPPPAAPAVAPAAPAAPPRVRGWRSLPRNLWAVSLTSLLMDVSSEMVHNLLPLFLQNALGVGTAMIGVIEGVAEATASVLKVFSGWFSDKLRARKWLAVTGYGISALCKPLFYFAGSGLAVLGARFADRIGKGVRTAPRDALVADSVAPEQRGLAFGLHRAADTAGAFLGLLIALGVVLALQAGGDKLGLKTFQLVVLISLVPAVLAVVSLATIAREVPVTTHRAPPKITLRGLGRPFLVFLLITGLFDLGNSSDAFLVLRAQDLGLSVAAILGVLLLFNAVYSLLSAVAGHWSDRIGRRPVLIGGWLAYAAIYLGFGLAGAQWQIWVLFALYGVYYGLAYGTAKAMVADLVPAELRGTAYGTYNAVLGLIDFPASVIAGVLWQGVWGWGGLGARAPFLFGGVMALLAALLMWCWKPTTAKTP